MTASSELNVLYDETQDEREWGIIAEKHAIRPTHDRVLILVDPIKTHYDCKDCSGRGFLDEVCPNCNGTKKEPVRGKKYAAGAKIEYSEENCTECTFIGEVTRTYGKKLCPTCHGRKGTIVLPDNTKKPPLTGKVLAVGHIVKYFKVNDHIIFTNFTGTEFPIEGVTLRIANERDIIGHYKPLNKTEPGVGIEQNKYKELEEAGLQEKMDSVVDIKL